LLAKEYQKYNMQDSEWSKDDGNQYITEKKYNKLRDSTNEFDGNDINKSSDAATNFWESHYGIFSMAGILIIK
jgi:hypothetical protein